VIALKVILGIIYLLVCVALVVVTLLQDAKEEGVAALGGQTEGVDEFTIIENLEKLTGTTIPAPLAATKGKTVRFTGSVEKQEMPAVVLDFLKKR